MIERADAAAGDDRNRNRVADGAGQLYVEAVSGAVPVHGGQEQFTRTQIRDLAGKLNGIDARRRTAAMGEDLPMVANPLGVDGNHDALRAELFRRRL